MHVAPRLVVSSNKNEPHFGIDIGMLLPYIHEGGPGWCDKTVPVRYALTPDVWVSKKQKQKPKKKKKALASSTRSIRPLTYGMYGMAWYGMVWPQAAGPLKKEIWNQAVAPRGVGLLQNQNFTVIVQYKHAGWPR